MMISSWLNSPTRKVPPASMMMLPAKASISPKRLAWTSVSYMRSYCRAPKFWPAMLSSAVYRPMVSSSTSCSMRNAMP